MERDTVSLWYPFFIMTPLQSGLDYGESITLALLETWARGWALTRGIAPLIRDKGGLRIDVGWPEQKTRYIFTGITEGLLQLACTIVEPYVFIKVCLPAEAIKQHLPPRWAISEPRFLMTCSQSIKTTASALPEGYILSIDESPSLSIVKILTVTGDLAAIGRIAIVDDHAIYDRIESSPGHRRKGLATAIMLTLENIAIRCNRHKGILVATAQGRALYETLGWQVRSCYTTAVILPNII